VSAGPVFVLGGAQTDFARNWKREGRGLADLVAETARSALEATDVDADEIEVGHIGNFASEIYCGQGHLGGLLVETDPAFVGLPTARHEAACASGSVAVLAAMSDLESGRYDVALVLGVEMMRNVPTEESVRNLGAAAWVPRETEDVPYVWPSIFSSLGDEYERRYGLDDSYLDAIARSNFANARRNPNAQTRTWTLDDASFAADDTANPVVAGRLRKQHCSQVTDGGAAVVLATMPFAARWAERAGRRYDELAVIRGWGHRTDRMALDDKLADAKSDPYVFPQVRGAALDAFDRAGLVDVHGLDAVEVHDCFATTHYMAIDHLGITPPGESWRAIEDGTVLFGGSLPINPSGGLMGLGHPVGASGARMLLDATKQVTGTAGDYQVEGARTVGTLNIGGSATTTVSFVVGRAADTT